VMKKAKKDRNSKIWQVGHLHRPPTLSYPHQICHVRWSLGHSYIFQVSLKWVYRFRLHVGSKSVFFSVPSCQPVMIDEINGFCQCCGGLHIFLSDTLLDLPIKSVKRMQMKFDRMLLAKRRYVLTEARCTTEHAAVTYSQSQIRPWGTSVSATRTSGVRCTMGVPQESTQTRFVLVSSSFRRIDCCL